MTIHTIPDRVATACFGAACAIGLAFAFAGFEARSLWFDELFTAKLLEPAAGTTLFGRIATDVHPPLYLFALAGFTSLFGESETTLRLPSALFACAAIVVFVAGTRAAFSLPARLFGAALATGSLFWFAQAQNARSYALCLLIVAGILALGLALLRQDRERRHRLVLPGLLALMLAGAFVHFYVLYASLAVLIALAVFERRDRLVLGLAGAGLVVAVALYLKLVIEPSTRVSLADNWYRNDPRWYLDVLHSCLQQTLRTQGMVALLLCGVAILYGRRLSGGTLRPDRTTLFLAAVPVLMLLGAIASSTLLAPNFWHRNFLVVSPFFWALAARAYDAAVDKATPALRLALAAGLGVLMLSMSSVATSRLPGADPQVPSEPFRQSAEWIRSLPACRGQTLAVITTDQPSWYKPGYAELIYGSAYGRYLQGFGATELVFTRDLVRGNLPSGLKTELQRRLTGEGCPVLAWTVHNMEPEIIAWIRGKLLLALDRPDAAGTALREFDDGTLGYVLYVSR